jgi:hypothetical protein
MDPLPSDIVRTAIDTLLAVVAKSAEDLKAFHDVVARARIDPLPPFPRATLLTTERIVDDLKRVEQDLRDVLAALRVPGGPPTDGPA